MSAATGTTRPPRLPVLTDTLLELRRRRLIPVALGVSVAFLGVFAAGFAAMYAAVSAEGTEELVGASSILTVMAMFVIHMLTALLAVLVAVGAVSGPRSSGMLQAVLARPISRASWLVQRWAALALVVVVYPIVMTSAVLVIVVAIAGYSPLDPVRAIAVLVLEGLVLVSLAIAASSRWSTVVSGVLVISAVGLAWIAGLVEVIGAALDNTIMTTIGVVISLAVPTDALWRGASYYLQSPAFLTLSAAAAEAGGTIPFAGNAPPTVALLAWSVAYAIVLLALAVRAVRRTDL